MKSLFEEMGGTYTLVADGMYYPELILQKDTDYSIGRYGRMRQEYLKKHRKAFYTNLILDGRLNQHLHQIEEECHQRLDMIMEQMKVNEGVTEELKARNQMLWVGKINNIRACVEEVIFTELIYK